MTDNLNITTVTIDKCRKLVLAFAKRKHPAMLWGAPGVGKTQLVGQIAAELGLPLRVFMASLKTPSDLSGIPVPDMPNGRAIWLRPSDLPTEACVFFLDEINTQSPMMQAALMQLVLERRCGDHHLHPDTIIIAAGNRTFDRAAAQRMPTALKNRFKHINVEPCVKAWTVWAGAAGVDPFLVQFLNFRPALLHIMPGQEVDDGSIKIKMDPDANAFPTPRSWADAGQYVSEPQDVRQVCIAAAVSDGPAAEFEGFLRVAKSLPTLQDMADNPKTATVPEGQPAAKYACVALIAKFATRETFDALLTYAARLGREYAVMAAVDAVRRNPSLENTAAYTTWAVANQDVTL